MEINKIEGGVIAAKGFRAAGIHCGLRKNKSKRDLALIVSDVRCAAAGVFTTNKVFAAPVGVSRAHLADGYARAIICNSGNANTCNADGYDKSNKTCAEAARLLGIEESDVVVASTGVIGVPLPVKPILDGIPQLISELGNDAESGENAAVAIMTTDTKKKEYAVNYEFDGKIITVGGICKGSGMIQPNMATMLSFVTTDADISPEMLKAALVRVVNRTFNMVSVDSDTSTNDTLIIMASAMAGNDKIESECGAYEAFCTALENLCRTLAKAIASDGEGASKLIECTISNAADEKNAKILAKSVINSPLVKTAMFGADANWGRILCALGYAGVEFDTSKVDVRFRSSAGSILVCQNGMGYPFDEETAKNILVKDYVYIDIDMKSGNESATAWGCDLSYEYVRINGGYRS
ncbi:MAG: bifunctional glutamate N-acetyltransferase/amino-acid acetyltransferase ArgJ [Eubacteriales bacterium]